MPGKREFLLYLVLFWILASGWLTISGSYLFFFQEQQKLFILSGPHLIEYFQTPGGIVEMAGDFLTSFYYHVPAGILILSVILSLPPVILFLINRRLSGKRVVPAITFLPSLLLLLLQVHYYHFMSYNIGVITILLIFLLSLKIHKGGRGYSTILLIPFCYYVAGGWVWIFTFMYLIRILLHGRGRQRFLHPLLAIGIAVLTIFISVNLIFIRSLSELILSPLPVITGTWHFTVFIFFAGIMSFYPLFIKAGENIKIIPPLHLYVKYVQAPMMFMFAAFMISRLYNPENAKVLEFQKLTIRHEWDRIIELHESSPSRNMIGQYFYNVALSETGQLADRLFLGKQDFGSGSLILRWGNQHLERGTWFYFSSGLINEAHRWSYESMVVNGFRPQTMKFLALTNIINGNRTMAGKYLGILRQTFFYNSWAKEYENLLDDFSALASHPVLGEKMKMLPENNFFIDIDFPLNNLPLLRQEKPSNRPALEYMIAWNLLQKDVEELVKLAGFLREAGYERIPLHMEEALLVYENSVGMVPGTAGLDISHSTRERFMQYVTTYTGAANSPRLQEIMRRDFENTFWYYFHFIQQGPDQRPT